VGDASPGSVLIVDDDEALCEVMELTLGRAHLDIVWRTSALDALDLVAERDFDAILTDFTMPTINGLELCARVHRLRPDVPVVIVSGRALAEEARAARVAGAFEFVVKPIDSAALVQLVERAVRHRRSLLASAHEPHLGSARERG